MEDNYWYIQQYLSERESDDLLESIFPELKPVNFQQKVVSFNQSNMNFRYFHCLFADGRNANADDNTTSSTVSRQ